MSYKLLERQVIYSGKKCRLELHDIVNEETGSRHKREVVAHPGAVVVLGFLDDGQILLIRNYRYAVGQTLIELPAGTLEKNEDPMNCAGRELLEETGYLATKLAPLCVFYTSPGILSERMYAYAAYGLQKELAALEEGEDIELMPVKWEQAMEMVGDGTIKDGKTIATLLWFDRFRREKNTDAPTAPRS
jgi:ADP-ribose pyrophosphatase